jgi:hypothetical protein
MANFTKLHSLQIPAHDHLAIMRPSSKFQALTSLRLSFGDDQRLPLPPFPNLLSLSLDIKWSRSCFRERQVAFVDFSTVPRLRSLELLNWVSQVNGSKLFSGMSEVAELRVTNGRCRRSDLKGIHNRVRRMDMDNCLISRDQGQSLPLLKELRVSWVPNGLVSLPADYRMNDIIFSFLLEIPPLESFILTGPSFSQSGWKQFASRHNTLRYLKLEIEKGIYDTGGARYTVRKPQPVS